MTDVPMPAEVSEFVANLVRATRRGVIPWEPNSPNSVVADIADGYKVLLKEVADFDGSSDSPDHIIVLSKGGRDIFSIDRRVLTVEDLTNALRRRVQHPYTVMSELWSRAWLKAQKIDEHLGSLNKILSEKIGPHEEEPSDVSDDDVPF